MKILYAASNPLDQSNLNLEREITEIQRRAAEASAEPIDVVFLPGLRLEDLPRELNRHRPDVFHLAAHGENEHLKLSNELGKAVDVTARMLAAFINRARPPRLVYLNACNSTEIAKSLVDDQKLAMAIGSTAPITNLAARNAALSFYEILFDGGGVADAFETGKQMLEALEGSRASVDLHSRADIDPRNEVLYRRPRLVAILLSDLTELEQRVRKGLTDAFPVRLGIVGCSPNTTQVVFFTDDETFINPNQADFEENLCLVVRGTPVRGAVWGPPSAAWDVSGDFRLFASGVSSPGEFSPDRATEKPTSRYVGGTPSAG